MGGLRRVFGRAPLVFPNLFLPAWQIEGFATYEESRMTGQGRVPAGDFRALVDTPARQRRFDPIDRTAGGLDDWPDGHAQYAYGAYFQQYLSDRFGAERVEALADATAALVPLLGAPAFKQVFGEPVSSLWRQFREDRERTAVSRSGTDAAARRLTHDGFVVAAPRIDADGAIYYRTSNADGFPALMRLDAGTRGGWRGACGAAARRSRRLGRVRSDRVRAVGRAPVGPVRRAARRRCGRPPDEGRARGPSRSLAGRPPHRLRRAGRRPPDARARELRAARSARRSARAARRARCRFRGSAMVARRHPDRGGAPPRGLPRGRARRSRRRRRARARLARGCAPGHAVVDAGRLHRAVRGRRPARRSTSTP